MFIKKSEDETKEDQTKEDQNLFLMLTQKALDEVLGGGVSPKKTVKKKKKEKTTTITTDKSKILVLNHGTIDGNGCGHVSGKGKDGDQLSRLIKSQNIDGQCGLKFYKEIATGYNNRGGDWSVITTDTTADPDALVVQGVISVTDDSTSTSKAYTVKIYSEGKRKPFKIKILDNSSVIYNSGEQASWEGNVSTRANYK